MGQKQDLQKPEVFWYLFHMDPGTDYISCPDFLSTFIGRGILDAYLSPVNQEDHIENIG